MTIWLLVAVYSHTDVKLLRRFSRSGVEHMTHQETLKLFGLGDVDPAVLLDDFDVFYLVVESVKKKKKKVVHNCYLLLCLRSHVPVG